MVNFYGERDNKRRGIKYNINIIVCNRLKLLLPNTMLIIFNLGDKSYDLDLESKLHDVRVASSKLIN